MGNQEIRSEQKNLKSRTAKAPYHGLYGDGVVVNFGEDIDDGRNGDQENQGTIPYGNVDVDVEDIDDDSDGDQGTQDEESQGSYHLEISTWRSCCRE